MKKQPSDAAKILLASMPIFYLLSCGHAESLCMGVPLDGRIVRARVIVVGFVFIINRTWTPGGHTA